MSVSGATPLDLRELRRIRRTFTKEVQMTRDELYPLKSQPPQSYSNRLLTRSKDSVKEALKDFKETVDRVNTLRQEEDENALTLEPDDEYTAFRTFKKEGNAVFDLIDELKVSKHLAENLIHLRGLTEQLQETLDEDSSLNQSDDVDHARKILDSISSDISHLALDPGHNLSRENDSLTKVFRRLRTDINTRHTATLTRVSADTSRSSTDTSSCKLPKLDLPKFDGDIMNWASFWREFESNVDSKTNLSQSDKLSYLRKAMADAEVDELLKTGTENPDFYPEIVERIKVRFHRPREIHKIYCLRLAQHPKLLYYRKEMQDGLDKLKSIICSLRRSGQYDGDSIAYSLISDLIPQSVMSIWEQHSKKLKGVPPVDKLFDYVQDHVEAMDSTLCPPAKLPTHSDKKPFKQRVFKVPNHATSPVVSSFRYECFMCTPDKHPLYSCPKWEALTVPQRLTHIHERNMCHNCLSIGHTAADCRSSYTCRVCQQKHHSTIHQEQTITPSYFNITWSEHPPKALLMTVNLLIHSPSGQMLKARALIDPGAGLSMLSTRMVKLLNLPTFPANISFIAVQGTICKTSKHRTQLAISPLDERAKKLECEAAVVDTVTHDLPFTEMSSLPRLQHLQGLPLADDKFHIPGRIDLLLGSDMLYQVLTPCETIIKGHGKVPAAQQTIFGWAVAGALQPDSSDSTSAPSIPLFHTITHVTNDQLSEQMSRFWQLDQPNCQQTELSSVEEIVQANYSETTSYDPTSCRYRVALPKRDDLPPLGSSRTQAVNRFMNNERSIIRKKTWPQFQQVIQSYLDLNHAEEVPASELDNHPSYYLPMHAVMKDSSTSTKLRVVFDGSAVTSSGVSLNQCLLSGPTLHPSLYQILLKFRSYPIAISADISKMYREVELNIPDRDLHRFVWRANPQQPLTDYRMTRVTFGVSSSPYLAVRTLQQTALDHGASLPTASYHVHNSFYVDDLLAGAQTEEEALQLHHELRRLLSQGGFNLCKWRSSSPAVLNEIADDLKEKLPVKEVRDSTSINHPRALGLNWDSLSDVMTPHIQVDPSYLSTKRGIISDVSKTFDVLGWISPALLSMKLVYQHLWEFKIDWDDEVPSDLADQHRAWRDELSLLSQRQLPRFHLRHGAKLTSMELHGFSDASEKAYGAVLYLRSTYADQPPFIALITSKTKVAPLKPLSIPRLELCGALMLANLLTSVGGILKISKDRLHAWTDSSIVLCWLDGHPREFQTFVSNRVASILELIPPASWMHVPTKSNPADCASRGMMPEELLHHSLWWDGPPWLQSDPVILPPQPPRKTANLPEVRLPCHLVVPAPVDWLETKFSDYYLLIKVTAWCMRLVDKARKRATPGRPQLTSRLSSREIVRAELQLVRLSQNRSFHSELQRLSNGRPIPPSSRLKSLTPLLDSEKLLRVQGRLANSSLSYFESRPLILCGKDILPRLMYNHSHIRLGHCGPSLLLSYADSSYHVIGGRRLSRDVTSQCRICRRAKAATQPQMQADLPAERVRASPVFSVVGIDYAGPFYSKRGHTRRPTIDKSYMAIFVCFSTKAVHVDMVSDLTTESFLACLKRFISRRGCPTLIQTDNGSNFRGAKADLYALYQFLQKEQTQSSTAQCLLSYRIEWKMIPERSPHFGGLWEAAVKSVKKHLARIIGKRKLTFEQWTTVTAQIEAILNSRPLWPITSPTPDGIPVLTPGHFIIGRALTAYPETNLPEDLDRLRTWNLCQGIVHLFWRRWHKEYLQTLQKRNKWQSPRSNFQVDDIVIIKDNQTFSCNWPLGRILQTYPGRDGLIRVVKVRTATSTLKRSIVKISLIHREEKITQPLPSAAPGVCSGTDLLPSQETSAI